MEAWLKCKYMHEHLGEEYGGVVSSVTSFGIFVTLDAMYVEGLVHITELGGEYYRFDEAHQELRGERTGMRYAIGSRVQVQVSRVDLDGRRIDFRLVQDSDTPGLCASRDKDALPPVGRHMERGDAAQSVPVKRKTPKRVAGQLAPSKTTGFADRAGGKTAAKKKGRPARR